MRAVRTLSALALLGAPAAISATSANGRGAVAVGVDGELGAHTEPEQLNWRGARQREATVGGHALVETGAATNHAGGADDKEMVVVGVGDGDGHGADGFAPVTLSASIVRCGDEDENTASASYLLAGIRRRGILKDAPWEVACERVDKTAAPVRPFAMYPMTLTKYQGGVMGQCFDRGFVVLVSLRPVLEFYCQTGYSEYLQVVKNQPAPHGDTTGDGWVTCDTLMTPEDSTKYDQLQLAIERGSFNPVQSREPTGCVCTRGNYMYAYKASEQEYNGQMVLSMAIKCAPA